MQAEERKTWIRWVCEEAQRQGTGMAVADLIGAGRQALSGMPDHSLPADVRATVRRAIGAEAGRPHPLR